jgi:hypothetical protein
VAGGRGGRIGEDKEREKQGCGGIGVAEEFGHASRIPSRGEEGEGEVEAQEAQHHGQLIDAVRNVDAHDDDRQQAPDGQFGHRAPPVLTGVQPVEGHHQAEGGRVEEVGVAAAEEAFAGDGHQGGGGGEGPGLVFA